ncbi:bifunctional diaminohydroxyphosphoribosylaminopyrimidine deaminase/5-amino-6-(5-phosphoribosylamino)uracil reductase RibD [Undibacterium sp. Jales W-56]|uniref:bifunctional diaminohydroxyphosphoribosylaminopyrimidine deaminase/5-amino-6-(5-phosphoribosylamino)uracil reductase RibD n=1 Tax=Undibacterium sp. Jales W-56 TaxID=2897325 RepID=UPI0021CFCEBC|nr:bifunctional diaminohydroxyphosphoribosylaminopyrimidine deaminase/5-amino-6-(5-phosphoribosylamino)uracil reductase RibD [Undibacterium sp. Jales W-56]MCU6432894.1 bifunctional diaminohydroxyphosphoribosylaminopyrimidine deaminase/5-amino-6-(5-phosphoribosylamino)uracil reductase RibD [Undibacterium sp. Jales W-56]
MDIQIDTAFMQMALELASRATIATSPNPKVGCVIVKDGQVIGRGWTQPVGQAHAEVQALRDAAAQGRDVRGATAYVTLEPCSHHGRTPPCANALIDAGIARVVAAVQDANPQVAGRGLTMLRDAGIHVESGLLAQQAREMNIGFFKRMETGMPWVRMKVAASLDGRTALPNGESQWITASDARDDGHQWRARADAILTGIGTVLADDPQMNVRAVATPRQPLKVVLDSHLRIAPEAKLLQDGSTILVCAQDKDQAFLSRQQALAAKGAEILHLPDAQARVDLPALLLELGRRQINELHVEAGATLNGALLAQHCVDELLVYLSPKILGDGAGFFHIPELKKIAEARQVVFHEVRQIGDALRILARF